ncbi:MAG: hypothetical protein AAF629_20760 [Chloroflexota bacterium]
MYQVYLVNNGQNVILRPEVEAVDAIYWVNRISELGYRADVVRSDDPKAAKQTAHVPELAVAG